MLQALIQSSWLIPLYGLVGVVLGLPWSTGYIKRNGSRPAAYINILMTLLSFVHGALVLVGVWGKGETILDFSGFRWRT